MGCTNGLFIPPLPILLKNTEIPMHYNIFHANRVVVSKKIVTFVDIIDVW